jgi:CRP-like cAMP-binding protein
MSNQNSYFPSPRSDVEQHLVAGDNALAEAMKNSAGTYAAGHVLVKAEEYHDRVYRLISGTVARLRVLDAGRRQIICVFTPGDLLAVKAMLLDRQPDSIECLSTSRLSTLDYKDAISLAAMNSNVGFRLLWQIAEDERRLHNNVAMLGRGNAVERISTMLVDITGRRGKIRIAGDAHRQIQMRQQDIADYCGITTVHVNRTLRSLRQQGGITVHKGMINITDLAVLVRHALPMLDIFERESPEFTSNY